MSQIIVCFKKYAKDSRMVYYFRLEFEVQIDAHSNGYCPQLGMQRLTGFTINRALKRHG